ncbi:phenylpropionate dioxygenase-like ring-hydroxylating dioxygenase large terminal subunit [Panacagrimonas perspica]|uniref:Phenylpropionate dioxygenase-like ring-hydroxylating dioxygenase large terminal subunit n=1 Tax=Panacagrimonas perspica TaxID=381431 RepID=A0A4R7P3L3_9GAMM|nr:aromatic ring-hydroxylating dioxygenase subunit alpha [Panacagrimonas perspica]TDU28247.1 phenylpropionate dioxygenase-like ring-hydroxylating dioxygenase large terminal subunit [Panacagrimonas perspica]
MTKYEPEMQKSAFPKLTEPNGLDTGPIPIEPYISPEWFEKEREQIFGRAWLCMGRIEQLPEPDTYIVKEIEVRGVIALITRDKADKVRAFHNVCSHRANMIVQDSAGKGSRFVCKYHNWAYRNDGDCIGVPDRANFFNLDIKKCGLTPIVCDVWEGWIFINLQKVPEVSLKEFLGPFGEAFTNAPAPSAEHAFNVNVSTMKANWKTTIDAFCESYHVPVLHPDTVGATFANDSNPYSRPLSGHARGAHRTMTTFGNPDYVPPEHALVERLAYSNLDLGNTLGANDAKEIQALLDHPAINPRRVPNWATEIAWIFPNFLIFYSPGGFFTLEFWPLSVNSTRWVARMHIPKAKDVRQRFQQEHHNCRMAEIFLEDVGNLERQQRAMESGAKTEIVLQDGEFMLRHSIETIRKWVAAKTVREALA